MRDNQTLSAFRVAESAVRGYRLLDRQARELVPESDVRRASYQHTRGEALIEVLGELAAELLKQPQLHLPGNDRGRLSSLRAGSDRRVARARTASRTVSGSRSPPAAITSVT